MVDVFIFINILLIVLMIFYLMYDIAKDKREKEKHEKALREERLEYLKEIRRRRGIRPEEKAKRWVRMKLCAPSVKLGRAADIRCLKFNHNCHDCSLDYAKKHPEHAYYG